MLRRRFLAACAFVPALRAAGVDAGLTECIGDLAAALADGNAAAFMRLFAAETPDRRQLERDVRGLVAAAECTSSVAPWDDTVEGNRHSVEADWSLQVRARGVSAAIEQRRERVTLVLVKRGRHWRFVDVQPRRFFAR
jgi:hypothetical protein